MKQFYSLSLVLWLISGCASKVADNDNVAPENTPDVPEIHDTTTPQTDLPITEEDVSNPDVGTPKTSIWDTIEVTDCVNKGAGTQSCFFTYRYDAPKCGSKGCSRLMVFFSGGLMSCPDPADDSAYLGKIAKLGFVSVCARLYEDSQGAGAFPYHLEAERVDAVLLAISQHKDIQSAWTGEHLLLTGASHGATAPVAAMARTALEEQPHWKGSGVTGACFFDGIYDIPQFMTLLHENKCNAPVSYERTYSRYCTWPNPSGPEEWPEPASCMTSGVINDSITELPGSVYAVDHWKMIECGSAAAPCTGDIVPAKPIEAVCAQIDSEAGKECEYKSYASVSHVTCGRSLTNAGACWQWFNALIQKN